MLKIKYLVLGFILGLLLGGSVAWAAARYVLVNGTGVELGTTANPITITIQ